MFQSPIQGTAAPRADRIAVVIAEFSTGGSERIAIRLANNWAKAGRDVTIFCGSEEGPTRALVERDVLVRPILPRLDRARLPRLAMGRALANQLRGAEYDVVVGPGNYHVPMLDALARALPKQRPAIVCKISNPLIRPDRSRFREAVFLANLRRSTTRFDRLVAMSPSLQREARKVLHRPDVACAAEPNLVDGRVAPERYGQSGLILCVGRLVPQKNFGLALDAFARIAPTYRLAILGEGEDYPALRERAESLGIADRVHFAGFVEDVRPWLAHADALLSTSRFEGYPAALVEALAERVPVVTTRCSLALPDIMFDESFGMTAADDAAEIARHLQRVLDDGRRPETAPLERLARRNHDLQAASDWLGVLDEAVRERSQAMRSRPAGAMIPAIAPLMFPAAFPSGAR